MTTQELERCDTADAVLDYARSQRAARDAAEVAMYEATCTWAAMHTTSDPARAAVLPGTDLQISIAGPGAPSVSEFAIIEYGTAIGLSADAAVGYVAHVVETRYRLPRLHAAVTAGRVPVWRARRIAEATLALPAEAAEWVDRHLAGVAATCSYAALARLVEEALCRFDPETAEDNRAKAAESRKLDIHLDTATRGGACIEGTADITGCLDLADALDLENAVAREARNLALAGSDQPLDVRRSQALGILARTQTTLDLTSTDARDSDEDPAPRVPARQVVLNIHLTDTALAGTDPTTCRIIGNDFAPSVGLHLARIEETRSFIGTDQLCEWLRVPGTHVSYRTITDTPGPLDPEAFEHPFRATQHRNTKPTGEVTAEDIRRFASAPDLRPHPRRPLDLAEEITIPGYTPSDRLAEQTRQRHPRCVFPHCTRRARRRTTDETHADLDHITTHDPDGPPGQTTTSNLATLCRRHHRAKTHAAWTYHPTPTGFIWTSPHRYQYLVEPRGTTDLGDHHRNRRPGPSEPAGSTHPRRSTTATGAPARPDSRSEAGGAVDRLAHPPDQLRGREVSAAPDEDETSARDGRAVDRRRLLHRQVVAVHHGGDRVGTQEVRGHREGGVLDHLVDVAARRDDGDPLREGHHRAPLVRRRRRVGQHPDDQPVPVAAGLTEEGDVPGVEQVTDHVDVHPRCTGRRQVRIVHVGAPLSRPRSAGRQAFGSAPPYRRSREA